MADFIGQGPAGLPGGTSKVYTTPWPLKPGARARDVDGNEYLFVDYLNTLMPGLLCVIDDLNRAGPLLVGSSGRVGVCMAGATSDNAGWVQIWGSNTTVQTQMASDAAGGANGSGVSSSQPVAQTTVTTPSGTIAWTSEASGLGNRIFGLTFSRLTPVQLGVAGATDSSFPTTYTTAATDDSNFLTHTGNAIAVNLAYPYVTSIIDPFGT